VAGLVVSSLEEDSGIMVRATQHRELAWIHEAGISLSAAATAFATVARTSMQWWRGWAQDEREAREEARREMLLREVDIGGKVCALLT
jgi:hypothetical protein